MDRRRLRPDALGTPQGRGPGPDLGTPEQPGGVDLVGTSLGGGSLGGGWGAQLERWAAEARVDAAAEARAREHRLRRQAEEDATLAGAFADLADAGATVRVRLRAGETVVGVVQAVGEDVVALADEGVRGGVTIVALAAVASVRTGAGVGAVTGDRAVASSLRLVDVLVGLAADREVVRVATAGGERVTGELRWVGIDAVMLRDPAPGASSVSYVPMGAIEAVVVGA